jgi:hypothetical protein
MARITIPVEQLPAPDKNGNHNVQFRVISEDRNKASAWSTLYTIKSIGQYRPLQSDVDLGISDQEITLIWETPTTYNYHPLLTSASIDHNHSIRFKKHPTDIFVKWDSLNFEYHERTDQDAISISIPETVSASVRVLGTIATQGIDRDEISDQMVEDLSELFLVFDTGTQLI